MSTKFVLASQKKESESQVVEMPVTEVLVS